MLAIGPPDEAIAKVMCHTPVGDVDTTPLEDRP
jgi:hypothetical protein